MRFLENTRKPQGFGLEKLMTKIVNSDAPNYLDGILNISQSLMLKFWTLAVAAESAMCGLA